ncbi:MAG: ribonuclease HII [Bacteroidota bacterium]
MLRKYHHKELLEAGLDEAGRGCFAGPVCAAAVILGEGFSNEMLNDSKQLTEKQRNILRVEIEEKALAWAVAMVDNNEIDEINILNASFLAMHRALDKLAQVPEFLLVDGNRFNPYKEIPHECMVKGDARYLSIAAASVLAKTHRDEYMMALHQKHPEYNWLSNKGYPTRDHKNAINKFGITAYHRKSFNMNEQLSLGF